jgi:hypothetical protein
MLDSNDAAHAAAETVIVACDPSRERGRSRDEVVHAPPVGASTATDRDQPSGAIAGQPSRFIAIEPVRGYLAIVAQFDGLSRYAIEAAWSWHCGHSSEECARWFDLIEFGAAGMRIPTDIAREIHAAVGAALLMREGE